MSGEETMPLAKRMEKTQASPMKIKQEPVDPEPEASSTENLRSAGDDLNGTIELSDDDYDPLVNLYVGPGSTSQEEEGIALHPDEGDLAIDTDLDYEPETNRGESILDEVRIKLTKNFLDDRRPFRIERETEVKWFSGKKNKTIVDCDLEKLLFILFTIYYTIYTPISTPSLVVDSLLVYIII